MKLLFDIKTFVLSIFEWPLKTCFTVYILIKINLTLCRWGFLMQLPNIFVLQKLRLVIEYYHWYNDLVLAQCTYSDTKLHSRATLFEEVMHRLKT